MDLSTFVNNTLCSIVNGIRDAQKSQGTDVINPTGVAFNSSKVAAMFHPSTHAILQQIEFDVAVTATDGSGTKAGISVLSAVVGLGASGHSEASNQTVSRVKFSVPVFFPTAMHGRATADE